MALATAMRIRPLTSSPGNERDPAVSPDATRVAQASPAMPTAIAAGTVFTFSLSLGDYITVQIVGGKSQLLDNLIQGNVAMWYDATSAAGSSATPSAR